MGVSDGSKTLSLEQVYAEEFSLPDFDIQCNILNSLKSIKSKLDTLAILKKRYYWLYERKQWLNRRIYISNVTKQFGTICRPFECHRR